MEGVFTEALLGITAESVFTERCVATHDAVRLGSEKTPLSLLLRNRRVYRLLWLHDSSMA
jgi:hypothetical protein